MNKSIICIGNRFVREDSGGPAVFDRLQAMNLPQGLRVVEGGLAGLNLLPHLELGGRVVFVDRVCGFAEQGQVVLLDKEHILDSLDHRHYGHEAGLPYLLSVFPLVCDKPLTLEVYLVGMEGEPGRDAIERSAAMSLGLALNGREEGGAWARATKN